MKKNSVDDADFPTVKDAAMIAKGVKYENIKKNKEIKNTENTGNSKLSI